MLEITALYSPAQNGIVERLNRVLVEYACAILLKHNLPKFLWEDAVAYTCYLKNRFPTWSFGGKTPCEVFWGKVPDLTNLREFRTNI